MGKSKSKKKTSESPPSAAASAAAESKEDEERVENVSVASSTGSGASGESVDLNTPPTESLHYTDTFQSILTAISSGPVSVAVKAFKSKLSVIYNAFTYVPEDVVIRGKDPEYHNCGEMSPTLFGDFVPLAAPLYNVINRML